MLKYLLIPYGINSKIKFIDYFFTGLFISIQFIVLIIALINIYNNNTKIIYYSCFYSILLFSTILLSYFYVKYNYKKLFEIFDELIEIYEKHNIIYKYYSTFIYTIPIVTLVTLN